MHVRLGNVLDDDRNVEVPRSDSFIIGGRHESTILVDEGDRVDRSQVLVILLSDFSRVHVVLQRTVNH